MADGGGDMFTDFYPDAGNTKILRTAFGRFATGVTVVTCDSVDGPIGITANSFSSISLDPALVMWAPAKQSARFGYFDTATHFAIHVLDADQHQICQDFATRRDAFSDLDHSINEHGVPLIENCLARFSCVKNTSHDAGDHQIIVGQVLHAQMRDGDALAFYGGKFGEIQTRP